MEVRITKRAEKDLARLPREKALHILQSLKKLSKWPKTETMDVVRLKGAPANLYRLRLGEHRVVFLVEEDIVYILRVIPRQDLEKAIRQLLQG